MLPKYNSLAALVTIVCSSLRTDLINLVISGKKGPTKLITSIIISHWWVINSDQYWFLY